MRDILNKPCPQAVERDDEQQRSHDAIDGPHAASGESRTYLVDNEGDNAPPQHGTGSDEDVTQNNVVPAMHLGVRKTETGKQRDDQKQNQRIRQGEQETGNGITCVVVLVVGVIDAVVGWVVQNHIGRIYNEDDATQDLQHRDIALDEVSDKADAQSCQQAIKEVAGSSTQSREESRLMAFVECTLHGEDADGSHRSRQNNPNRQATYDE